MPLIIPANTLSAAGYEVANSCRFDSGSDAYLTKTPGSAGSTTTGTLSWWMKYDVGTDSGGQYIYTTRDGSNNQFIVRFHNKALKVDHWNGSGYDFQKATSMLFRDPSAWYHICIKIDTGNGTAANRIKLFVNGVATAWGAVDDTVAEDFAGKFFTDANTLIGSTYGAGSFYEGYLAEFVGIDGTAYDADSFGEFDSDSPTIWKPIDSSGLTFGTNGFYLDFEDSANLGNDANGGTDWSETNLAATDQASDSPTNNFATWNPLTGSANLTYSEGNTKATSAGSGTPWRHATSSIAVASGKWYFEVKKGGSDAQLCSVADAESSTSNQDNDFNELIAYDSSDGNKRVGGTSSSYGDSYANGDIVGIALDMTNQFVYFSKNGTWQNSGDPTSGATGTGGISTSSYSLLYFDVAQSESHSVEANFGNPSFTVSSANQDANGYGNFEYAPPSGYYALCTKNLAEFG